MKRIKMYSAGAALALAFVLIALAMPAHSQSDGDAPTEREVGTHLALKGPAPFMLRGWTVTFSESSLVASHPSCPLVIGSWNVQATRIGQYAIEFNATMGECGTFSLTVDRVTP